MSNYITAKEVNISCKFEGQAAAEMIHIRKGVVFILDTDRGVYVVDKPETEDEKRVFLNEPTLIGFKELKALISMDAKKALAGAKSGNNVQLEKKVIELVNENQEQKERIEVLEKDNKRLTETLAKFTESAANQQDADMSEEEEEIPDYEAMTVAELKAIAEDNGIDITGMKKPDLVNALLDLHEPEEE